MRRRNLTKVMAAALAATMTIGMAGCGGGGETETTGGVTQPAGGGTGETTAAAGGADETTAAAGGADETTAAAGGTEETTAAAEEDLGAYTVRTDENGNVYDLGGMEIIIRDWFSAEPGEPANAMDEARQDYLDWIQETYNFKIKSQNMNGWGDTHTEFVNYATSGGDENYIFTLWPGAELVSEMDAELMYDLSTLDCLDFTEKKFAQNGVHELWSKNGKIFGMRAAEVEPRSGMFFNKRLLNEAGINPDDLYTWVQNGEWTWAKFEECCEKIYADTDNDGVYDRYPLCQFNDNFYTPAVFSNGGEFIGMENGKYVNKLESAETMEALNWARGIINKYRKPDPEDAAWDYCYTAFINGEGAFMADEAYNAGPYNPDDTGSAKFCKMVDDFGFVPFPKGPKADDYMTLASDNVFVIPGCYDADKAWKIAFAYDLYTEPTPGYEDVSTMTNQFYSQFRDMESVDVTIAILSKCGAVQYHSLVAGIKLGEQIYWQLSDENTPAQQAEAIRNTWDAYIAKANGEITQEELDAELAAETEAETEAAEGE